MRFALLGNHPDGLAMAEALVATGRHTLAVVCDVEAPAFAAQAKRYPEIEEVLADPEVELVIVAGPLSKRGEQLRRAVQSERDVLCVHPCGEKPDIAYEVAIIQAETKRLLLPLLPDSRHPVVNRLREHWKSAENTIRLLSVEQETPGVGEPPWDMLRHIGGEIVEVSGLAEIEEIDPQKPLLWSGRFEAGGLIDGVSRPAATARTTFTLAGASEIVAQPGAGFECWAALVAAIESARENPAAAGVTWQDEVRALELQDALRRSVAKRRTSSLEYQEINEEVGSKGTMTLIGCGMIWVILLLSLVAIWQPLVLWLVVPLLLAYLGLLGMSWLARGN